jgi:hypothetical protein
MAPKAWNAAGRRPGYALLALGCEAVGTRKRVPLGAVGHAVPPGYALLALACEALSTRNRVPLGAVRHTDRLDLGRAESD